MTDTIFAPATALGRAGVAVVRVSGSAAAEALRLLTGRGLPRPREATVATIRDPQGGEVLDRGLVLWFPAPRSATGEDVAEFHVHGGRAVVNGLTAALQRLGGVRFAEPGEFTRRAFENGKLDLTAAEAIADLVEAETEAQRRQALRQLDGELGRLYDGWRSRLSRCLAHLEAYLDFPDEDLPADVLIETVNQLVVLRAEIAGHLADGHRGERLREGIEVAILGPPNAGKSSLLNAIAGADVVIVSERAGTTRDVVEVRMDLGGYPVVLADTAGLREAVDAVESEGVRRALARADRADLKMLVVDAGVWPVLDDRTRALAGPDSLLVVNKADTCRPALPARMNGAETMLVSARTGEGVSALLEGLAKRVAALLRSGTGPTLTRARHRGCLEDAVAALERAPSAALPELMAEDLRFALRAIGRITGRVDVDELLDIVFRDFCIGK